MFTCSKSQDQYFPGQTSQRARVSPPFPPVGHRRNLVEMIIVGICLVGMMMEESVRETITRRNLSLLFVRLLPGESLLRNAIIRISISFIHQEKDNCKKFALNRLKPSICFITSLQISIPINLWKGYLTSPYCGMPLPL